VFMSQEELFINGDLLRLRRETQGWALSDMATRACMSVKQIRQLEEGGMSAFYSAAVKATAAKKVGALLGASAEEVFGQVVEPLEAESALEEPLIADVPAVPVATAAPAQNPIAEPAEPFAQIAAPDKEPVVLAQPEETKSKTSLWVIAGLFAAALAVAAYMQPQDEPAAEPEPPLQVVPSEATDAASAAEAQASSASGSVETVVVPTAQKPASLVSAPVAVATPAPAASKAP
jgi:transcriptional regulator with XRE-family HTH domain